MPTAGRHVLISGASTGIGRACTIHLAAQGFSVFAGTRREEDGALLEKLGGEAALDGGGVSALRLDVTDRCSITAAMEKVKSIVGEAGLAGLVNNAGIGINGPVEFTTLEQWRTQFEVNFFGQIAVTQAALPLLRQHVARFGPGSARIVNMSSIAGKVAQPVFGPYCSSKFALEAMTDSLRLELRPQGILVCLVNPGAIDTPIWKKGLDAAQANEAARSADDPVKVLYGQMIHNAVETARKTSTTAAPPTTVARAVAACLTRRKPRIRTFVGNDARTGAAAKRFMPDGWFDAALARFYQVPKPG
jgi:NAD(P)-dependent dehydrogenase (short-subunit alcohol dehydrogenase family)